MFHFVSPKINGVQRGVKLIRASGRSDMVGCGAVMVGCGKGRSIKRELCVLENFGDED